jgi:hypothetical protein
MLIRFRQARRRVADGPRPRAREALVVGAVAGRHVEVVAAVRRRGYGAESGGAAAAGEAADLGHGSGEYCVLIDVTHRIFSLIGLVPRVCFPVRFVMLGSNRFVWPCANCEFLMSLHQPTLVTSVSSYSGSSCAQVLSARFSLLFWPGCSIIYHERMWDESMMFGLSCCPLSSVSLACEALFGN